MAELNKITTLNARAASHYSHLNPLENSIDNYLMKQFIKCPASVYHNVNPWKTLLSFDGSNYSKQSPAYFRTLLKIVEFNEITSANELFNLPRNKCKRFGRRHKIILINQCGAYIGEGVAAGLGSCCH
ncbi:hypothetical protein VP01_1679g1 [Puccinia sorghi]|uniref:Uncharacterized protein n=1 Tax=Puccinia sorghi TaxID=27349 RepID=A0A0L6VG16_9BASI|nr:hypothetical protein VP01_1679g1 [Puccinia sorghi]